MQTGAGSSQVLLSFTIIFQFRCHGPVRGHASKGGHRCPDGRSHCGIRSSGSGQTVSLSYVDIADRCVTLVTGCLRCSDAPSVTPGSHTRMPEYLRCRTTCSGPHRLKLTEVGVSLIVRSPMLQEGTSCIVLLETSSGSRSFSLNC